MFKYYGFGLKIISEIELPELQPGRFDEADISIKQGTVPEKITGVNIIEGAYSMLSEQEYILNVKNVCKYYAGHGNTIIVQPHENADNRSIHVFLLGTTMGVLLYQRQLIPVHASAIVKDGGIILFTGKSGGGKSTLLSTFVAKGYDAFTDDICVLDKGHDDIILGAASYPMIKLWENTIEKLEGKFSFNKEFKMRPHLPKYGHFFHDSFITEKLPVTKIFILDPQNHATGVNCSQVKDITAFDKLQKSAYKGRFLTGNKLRQLYFSYITLLTKTATVYNVTRPVAGNTIDELSDTIEAYF